MPTVTVGGAGLHYHDSGSGEPVVLLAGTGAGGRTWHLHQVPALVAAGYRCVTPDNRGIPPSDPPNGPLTVGTLVADTAGLIETLNLGPCRLVGSSMGAHLAQELSLARPDLVRQAVLMAGRARPDPMSLALTRAEKELHDSGVTLPPAYDAVVRAMQNLSPRTLADPQSIMDWLDLFEMSNNGVPEPGTRAQLDVDLDTDRRAAYGRIGVPILVIGFADDLIAPPPHGRELAAAIPGARYVEVDGAGHYGYLERPEPVNEAILAFFKEKL